MPQNTEKGFSLIELVLVVTIIMVIASISIQYLSLAKIASENGSAVANLRNLSQNEVSFNSIKGRYAKLSELNTMNGGSLGTMSGNKIVRGPYNYETIPSNPSLTALTDGYTIVATRTIAPTTYSYSVDQTGVLNQLTPISRSIGSGE